MTPPPMVVGSKRPPTPSIYPDGDLDDGTASEDEDKEGGLVLVNPKKRRQSVEQVRTLEKNFEVGNKLEPERKLQLARALGLQPRQVAIWFQNRRACWKSSSIRTTTHCGASSTPREPRMTRSSRTTTSSRPRSWRSREEEEGAGSRRRCRSSSTSTSRRRRPPAGCSENSSEINLDISRPPPPATTMHRASGAGAVQFYASLGRPGLDIENLLHSHSSSPPLKMELGTANFGNLLCGSVDEPPQFWQWAADGHNQFN